MLLHMLTGVPTPDLGNSYNNDFLIKIFKEQLELSEKPLTNHKYSQLSSAAIHLKQNLGIPPQNCERFCDNQAPSTFSL